MLKAIIFDADGTLYNVKTKRAYFLVADFLSKETGISAEKIIREWEKTVDKIKFSQSDWSNPVKRQRKYALQKSLLALGADKSKVNCITDKALIIFWQAIAESLEIFPENIKEIKNLGENYQLVVTSEEFKNNLILKLNRAFGNWEKYFKFLITPEETGIMKPSEKYYLKAMEKLSLKPEEILAAGDSDERDLLPAKKLGIKTIKISPCEFSKLTKMIATIK